MRPYIARRVAALVPVWLLITLFAFALANLAPGDPAELFLRRQTGEPPSAEAVALLRAELGLDDPLPVRYVRWLGNALTGDFGTSYRTGAPVASELRERFGITLELAIPALLVALLIALPAGVISAVRRNSPLDHGTRLAALIGASMPGYWLGYVLILALAVNVNLLPVAGRGGLRHLALPVLTLALGAAAGLTRLTRASLLDVLGNDYVRTARSKGAPERRVVWRHALRNALVPVVTLLGIGFGHLVAGAAIIETVFAWPGLGKHVIDSIYDRDYPTIQGFVLFTGTVFVAINLIVDLLYVWLDPRVRLAAEPES
ncbi:MAG: ABC transporter permease [Actinomycetota bacterium]|nr:ABC transporter permease [Actinomycetota bacterium]